MCKIAHLCQTLDQLTLSSPCWLAYVLPPGLHARMVVDLPWCMQVLVSDPKELDKIREREFDITKERIEKILAAGANVILTTKGIDDMSLKYFVEAGAIACRRVPKEDLRYQPLSVPV
jgi:chaperonin GroEL (HSP60 family)